MANRFDEILDDCINRISFKGETIESCVKRYREYADQLEQHLHTAVKIAHAYAFAPVGAAKEQARRRLVSEKQAIGRRRQKRHVEVRWCRWNHSWHPRCAMAGVAAILVILIGGVSAVGVSSNTLPGDILYPVKRTAEQITLSLQHSADRKARQYLEHGERRANEMAALIREGRTAELARLGEDIRQSLALATDALGAIKEEQDRVKLEEQIRQSATQSLENLRVALQEAPEASRQFAKDSLHISGQSYVKILESATARPPLHATTGAVGTFRLQATPVDLSTTFVPNIDLDVYVYAKQQNPTIIPKEIISSAGEITLWANLLSNLASGKDAKNPFIGLFTGTTITSATSDLTVESLALWGVVKDDDLVVGGALTLVSPDEAAYARAQIPNQIRIWATVSDRTLYFVYGSGIIAEQLKASISNNDFKHYNDQTALQEVARLPHSGTAQLAAVAVVKLNKSMAKLIAKYSDRRTSSIVDALVIRGRVRMIASGLYAPQEVVVADVVQKLGFNTMWKSDFGMVASVKSELPGFLVNVAVSQFLKNAGYVRADVSGSTLYRGSLNTGNGKTIPILFSLEGNRIFAALSANESYAETIIAQVNR